MKPLMFHEFRGLCSRPLGALRAFHNDPGIKTRYVERVSRHQAENQIRQGCYWKNGAGCAIGCTVHSNDQQRYEVELGLPVFLARTEEFLFENLPVDEARRLPRQFLEAIPVGADTVPAGLHFIRCMLRQMMRYADVEGMALIASAQALLQQWERQRVRPAPSDWCALALAGRTLTRRSQAQPAAAVAALVRVVDRLVQREAADDAVWAAAWAAVDAAALLAASARTAAVQEHYTALIACLQYAPVVANACMASDEFLCAA